MKTPGESNEWELNCDDKQKKKKKLYFKQQLKESEIRKVCEVSISICNMFSLVFGFRVKNVNVSPK